MKKNKFAKDELVITQIGVVMIVQKVYVYDSGKAKEFLYLCQRVNKNLQPDKRRLTFYVIEKNLKKYSPLKPTQQ